MNPVVREYVSKGLFLGLWAYLALVAPSWDVFGRILIWVGGGLAAGYIAGIFLQLMRGYKPWANPLGFAVLTLIDSSFFIYIGLIGGLGLGIVFNNDNAVSANGMHEYLGYFAVGGLLLGFLLYRLKGVHDVRWRFFLGIALAGAVIYFANYYIIEVLKLDIEAQKRFALFLLVGLPFFYVLTFCGEVEESEVEIAALCGALGVGLYLYKIKSGLPDYADKLILLVPLALYFLYVTRWQPGLRVFKHVLRGYGNANLGRIAPALGSFARAMQLDPKSKLAADGMWQIVRSVDITQLDEPTTKLLPIDFCLSMASAYLVGDNIPTAAQRAEAIRMLDVIERQRPDLQPNVDYLRCVALTHGRQYDAAADLLSRLLDPETPYNTQVRQTVLFQAWDLALGLHPELSKRLGEAELAKPGRRMEAIAATELHLLRKPNDSSALEMQRMLYAGLQESEFIASASNTPLRAFNYGYAEELGHALVNESNSEQAARGMAFLRIAGRGLPERGPSIFQTLAAIAQQRNEPDEMRGYLVEAKRSGQAIGYRTLAKDQQEHYITALKRLVELAEQSGDTQAAVDNMRLYVESDHEDVTTLRQLAELYIKNNDSLNALLITERGLLYAKADPDLLAKKETYYFSVDSEKVRQVRDKVKPWFDVKYCLTKATAVANQKEVDPDTLDWGIHLATLARIINPESQSVRLVEARLLLRSGQRADAVTILESIRKEERGRGDDEDAWYTATRILGNLYLDELNEPKLAVECLNDYREYQKSGADTLYRLGEAYEAIGNPQAAIKSYESVTVYPTHPRFHEATEAMRRLRG